MLPVASGAVKLIVKRVPGWPVDGFTVIRGSAAVCAFDTADVVITAAEQAGRAAIPTAIGTAASLGLISIASVPLGRDSHPRYIYPSQGD
jgi:hypothetical protein